MFLSKCLVGGVDSDEDVDDDGAGADQTIEAPGKIGKKKAEKLQAKAEKKLEREAMQRELEEKKKKKEKEDEEARFVLNLWRHWPATA